MTSIKPQKRFGQNFLIDQRVIEKIVTVCNLNKESHVVEIGPGKGAITELLSQKAGSLIAVEKDKRLFDHLNTLSFNSHVSFINKDFLSFDLNSLKQPTILVGNLPYNMATAIIEYIIKNKKNVAECFFMVQLEHANKMCAKPSTKDYGSFSCFVQYYAQVKKLFKIKNTCFNPKPKVESSFIHVTFHQDLKLKSNQEEGLFKLIMNAFSQRRKTLINSLSSYLTKDERVDLLNRLKINPLARAENLTLDDFINIYLAVS